MLNCFAKNQIYSLSDIIEICNQNNLVTIDQLKDDNSIAIEEFIDGELGGVCLFEFERVGNDLFILTWVDDC
jgi:5'(3')-deoxyribonucleotidase